MITCTLFYWGERQGVYDKLSSLELLSKNVAASTITGIGSSIWVTSNVLMHVLIQKIELHLD